MKPGRIIVNSSIILLAACVPISYSNDDAGGSLVHEDRNYSDQVKTVQLFPFSGKDTDQFQSPIIHINHNNPLILSFDLLQSDAEILHAKLIHCNSDWKQSWLGDIEYLNEFNEFPVNNFTYSNNTKVPYVHYVFRVPRLKVTGNYLLYVYRDNNPNNLLLSKRFVVYTDDAFIVEDISFPADIAKRNSHQQIQFSISHPKTTILNPLDEVKVVIRQNQRWDRIIDNLKPTFIREDLRSLEYRHFDGTNLFAGTDEFRFVDLRSLISKSQRVEQISYNPTPQAVLSVDAPRRNPYYSQNIDINGQYFIANLDRGGGDIDSDYVNARFRLKTNTTVNSPIYVGGKFSNYAKRNEYRMQYDSLEKVYKATVQLKQGFYNYTYITDPKEQEKLESNHFQTENQYEFLVYYRPQGARYDAVIAYKSMDYNKRAN